VFRPLLLRLGGAGAVGEEAPAELSGWGRSPRGGSWGTRAE